MSRQDLHFKLRLPAELKVRLEEVAKAANRTLTAEILLRLQRTFDIDDSNSVVPPTPDGLDPELMAGLVAMHTPGTRHHSLAKRLSELYDEAKAKAEAQFVAEASESLIAEGAAGQTKKGGRRKQGTT